MDLEKRRQDAVKAEVAKAAKLQSTLKSGSQQALASGGLPTDVLGTLGTATGGGALTPDASSGGSQVMSAADIAAAKAAARVNKLRGDIRGYMPEVQSVYDQLFADLDQLINARRGDIEKTSGESINKLTDQYVNSIPGIENSFAAVGAGDSTWLGDSKDNAKKGYETSVKEVGDQKNKDMATLGQYDQETRAGWNADREALNRIFSRLDETDNENDLADARNNVETKLGTAKTNRATLMTDEGLKGAVASKTDASGRLGSIEDSLKAVLNSSLANSVKDAAIAAVGQSAGLSDEEKNQIKANSGYTS